jgi:hypothetical protein
MGREVQQNCTYHATRDEFRLTSFDGVRFLTRTVPAIPRAPAEAFMLKTDSVSVVQWACAGTSRVGNAILFTFALLIVCYRDKVRWIHRASEAHLQAEESARKLEGLAAAGK